MIIYLENPRDSRKRNTSISKEFLVGAKIKDKKKISSSFCLTNNFNTENSASMYTWVTSFNPCSGLEGRYNYYPHFENDERSH